MNNKFIPLFYKLGLLMSFCLLFAIPSSGQLVWLEAQINEANKVDLVDLNAAKIVHTSTETILINYNAASHIQNDKIDLDLNIDHFNQCNIFTVYKSAEHASESLIWSIKESTAEQLSLTDQRMVDFSSGRFMNFIDFEPAQPQINAYQHYKNDYSGNTLSLGGKFSNSEIPVGLFEGELAELIVFNQVLAPASKARLESALAIKYSVPLINGHDYTDAYGEIIWNSEKHEVYSNRIAGLGRSDIFHLNQKQSQSKLGNGFITLGLDKVQSRNDQNDSNQPDQSYLLWGDDKGILEFEKLIGKPDQLQRNWKMEVNRFTSDSKINIQFNNKDLEKEIKNDEMLWLAFSANEDYNLDDTEYFSFKSESKSLHLESYFELNDKSNRYFTFIKAPKVWAKIEIDHSNCQDEELGSLDFIPVGGTPPFIVNIESQSTTFSEVFTFEKNDLIEIEDLELGQYNFTISDHNNDSWSTEFYINTKELPTPSIKSRYTLLDGEITLDAGLELSDDYGYLWYLPNGNTSTSESINISQSGQYQLKIEKGDCHSIFPFEVIAIDNNIQSASVSPNPTINGFFTLNATLREAGPYSVFINTIDGQLISSKTYGSAKYIHQSLKVSASGIYMITLISGSSKITKKLVANLDQ